MRWIQRMTIHPHLLQTVSLADKLTRALVMTLAAVWLVCIIGVSWFIYHEINENFDAELVESAHRLIDVAVNQYDEAVASGHLSVQEVLIAKDPIFDTLPLIYQLIDAQGKLVLRSAAAPREPFGVPLQEGFFDQNDWRIYAAQHPYRELYLMLADPQEERIDGLITSLLALVTVMMVVLLVLALLLRNIARRELRVLHDLQQQISQRNGSDLRPIEIRNMPRELHAVGVDVNRMLERLSEALNIERALAVNAAHELRTPLAIAMLRLQAALDGESVRTDIYAALDGLKILAHRTEKLLQLSRAESAASLNRQSVDLGTLVITVAGEFWGKHGAARNLDVIEPIDIPQDSSIWALVDPDTLAIALRNLIENALRYGRGAKVEVEVRPPATIIVRDYGPGVSAEQMITLQQRHVRHVKDSAGYGLGMSITNTIIMRNHGQMKLRSPVLGHTCGFEAEIHLQPFLLEETGDGSS